MSDVMTATQSAELTSASGDHGLTRECRSTPGNPTEP
jgi:hypothetical protein